MKRLSYVLVLVLALTAMLLSACGGAAGVSAPASTSGGGSKPQAMPVEFTGVIEAINGNQWTVGGQTISVDPAVVRDGPFKVGDAVKVEVQVQADGSMVVSKVELPAPLDVNSNDDNGNDSNSNDDNGNDSNSNDDNGNDSNSNDDKGGDDKSSDDKSGDDKSGDDSNGGGDDSGGDDD